MIATVMTWTKDMPEPPHGVDVLFDESDTGPVRYLCRRASNWSNGAWFWLRNPNELESRKEQTGMMWRFAAAQARGQLVVVRP